MKVAVEKIKSAHDFIFQCLHSTCIGDKLPPVRSLIEGSASSRAAVEIVLDEMEKKKLIRRIPRCGIIRLADSRKRTFELIGCHDGGYMKSEFHNFLNKVINGLIQSAEAEEYHFRIHAVGLDNSIEHYCRIASLEDTDGFILIRPSMFELVQLFKQTGKVVVVLFPEGCFTDCDQVSVAVSTVSMQMQYLLEHGHRRILYLREFYPQFYNMTLMFRRLEYFRLMAENGLQIPGHWQSEYPPGCILEALEKSFSCEPYPTALIIWDKDAHTVYDFLKSRNLVVGKDVSVIGTDGDLTLAGLQPPVTSVISHTEQVIESVWSLVKKQLAGDFTSKKVEVMLTLRHGLSVGMIPGQNRESKIK